MCFSHFYNKLQYNQDYLTDLHWIRSIGTSSVHRPKYRIKMSAESNWLHLQNQCNKTSYTLTPFLIIVVIPLSASFGKWWALSWIEITCISHKYDQYSSFGLSMCQSIWPLWYVLFKLKKIKLKLAYRHIIIMQF